MKTTLEPKQSIYDCHGLCNSLETLSAIVRECGCTLEGDSGETQIDVYRDGVLVGYIAVSRSSECVLIIH